ncbi:MAG: nuclear transport factor 2 family protein [Hyphomonadaceae bacterium]|nr:nuclear transport factor 2 family protein [Hyphomonadaceae bacterium]
MTAPSPTDIVDAQIAAYVAGDAAAFAAFYAPDAVCVSLPADRVVARGREDIERVWAEVFARRQVQFALLNRIAHGDFVIDHERVTRTADGVAVEAIATYEVRAGLIRHVWFFEPHP